MARIYKRGKQLWMEYYLFGKQHRESLGLRDTRENRILAKKMKLQKEADILNGIHPEIKKVRRKTLRESFNEFLITKENRSAATIDLYNYSYDKLYNFIGNVEIGKISAEHIKEFEKYVEYSEKKSKEDEPRKLSKNTIEIIFRHNRIIFEYFIKQKYIESNPFPKKEKVDKRINVVSKEEMNLILNLLQKHDENQYKAIKLLIMTGLRVSELVRLEFEDIDFKRNILYIKNQKGKRVDQFPLYRELRDFLLSRLFDQTGKVVPYKSRHSFNFFQRFLSRNKMNHYTIHELRKTFLSRLANSGISLYDLQKIGRHKDLRTTQKYYLEAEYNRMGNEINNVILSTITSTTPKNLLKTA